MLSNSLFIIPARKGSKGIPGKNSKKLHGLPLIKYTIDYAKKFADKENICVSTDDDEIIKICHEEQLGIHFKRPDVLAQDESSTNDVILHALSYFRSVGKNYSQIILLQPTSPFREEKHLNEAFSLYSNELDMVVSVKESKSNPYFNLFEENAEGFLSKSKSGNYVRRQDCPKVYEYNGSIYIINSNSIMERSISEFEKIRKYIMPSHYSIDLDMPIDWKLAEIIAEEYGF
jgi:N-acylneuraminate cytidylyltransferase